MFYSREDIPHVFCEIRTVVQNHLFKTSSKSFFYFLEKQTLIGFSLLRDASVFNVDTRVQEKIKLKGTNTFRVIFG